MFIFVCQLVFGWFRTDILNLYLSTFGGYTQISLTISLIVFAILFARFYRILFFPIWLLIVSLKKTDQEKLYGIGEKYLRNLLNEAKLIFYNEYNAEILSIEVKKFPNHTDKDYAELKKSIALLKLWRDELVIVRKNSVLDKNYVCNLTSIAIKLREKSMLEFIRLRGRNYIGILISSLFSRFKVISSVNLFGIGIVIDNQEQTQPTNQTEQEIENLSESDIEEAAYEGTRRAISELRQIEKSNEVS